MTAHLEDTVDAFADRIGQFWAENFRLDVGHLEAIGEDNSTLGAPEPERGAVWSGITALETRLIISKAKTLEGVMGKLILAAQYADYSGDWRKDKDAAGHIATGGFLVCSALAALSEITGEPTCGWVGDGEFFVEKVRENLADRLVRNQQRDFGSLTTRYRNRPAYSHILVRANSGRASWRCAAIFFDAVQSMRITKALQAIARHKAERRMTTTVSHRLEQAPIEKRLHRHKFLILAISH